LTKASALPGKAFQGIVLWIGANLADGPQEPRVPLDALDAHLDPADVMLDNRERFFDIPHVSAKRGNLGRNLMLSVVHLRQLLAHLMLLGAYLMLLGAQTVLFAKDAGLCWKLPALSRAALRTPCPKYLSQSKL